jgi:hypothetical protein
VATGIASGVVHAHFRELCFLLTFGNNWLALMLNSEFGGIAVARHFGGAYSRGYFINLTPNCFSRCAVSVYVYRTFPCWRFCVQHVSKGVFWNFRTIEAN